MRPQPSTRTNSRILNGSEIITGGSIIMPIDISAEATTRSITRNGMKIDEADDERGSQLRDHERRDQRRQRHVVRRRRVRPPRRAGHQRQVFLARVRQHEVAQRTGCRCRYACG